MARYRVTVVGATGLVGQELVKLLYQRQFPLAELRVLASRRSAGKALTLGQCQVYVGEARPTSFQEAFTASVRAHQAKVVMWDRFSSLPAAWKGCASCDFFPDA